MVAPENIFKEKYRDWLQQKADVPILRMIVCAYPPPSLFGL